MELKKVFNSFNYANEGIVYTINTQRNMKIHMVISLCILLFCMGFHITKFEAIMIFLAIAIVLTAEIFNTSIEAVVDHFTEDYHPGAKVAKDAAAGAVLISVLIVVIVGIIILLPYLIGFFNGDSVRQANPMIFLALQGAFILLSTYAVKAYWYGKKKMFQPSILVGLLFYVFVVCGQLLYEYKTILAILLLGFMIILLLKKIPWIVILQNGVISIVGFYFTYLILY